MEVVRVLTNVIDSIQMRRTFNQMQSLFLKDTPPNAAAAPIPEIRLASEQPAEEKPHIKRLRSILQKLGIIGESGSADIITLVDYMIEQGPESGKFTVSELCSKFSPNNSKSMEQRIRRTVNAGLTNLANMGIEDYSNDTFHDFAGSCAIHMVGGLSAFIGAAIEGARIGKFTRDEKGKVTKVHAFPGHNIVIGALGCFILWFGWYGFNGAAASTGAQLASIFMATTIAPAVATVVCMIFTWVKYGKPDVSMCLNASLAGLVAITAPCDVVDATGSIIIGVVAGLLVVFGVWFCDNVVHVDDPVGAVAVHCCNGIWGTIAVGLFATTNAPECTINGLFYGGGFHQLGLQLLGVITVLAWTAVTMTIVFKVIDKTVGLRVSEEEEIVGLDIKEHGLASAYAGFSLMDITEGSMSVNENTELGVDDYDRATEAQKEASVKVAGPVDPDAGMHKVVIIAKLSRYEKLKNALNSLGVTGMTVTQVMGCGIQKGAGEKYRGVEMDVTVLPKVKVEVIVGNIPVEKVIETAKKTLYTGHVGDGKIFVYNVQKVVKVRTGEEDLEALKDVE